MEVQSHEPTNAVYLNGRLVGHLPVKDYVYSWYAATFDVPDAFLQPGYNELRIQAGALAPQLQGPGFMWDDVLFRAICLERTSAD
jgi:hypothetical protein